MTVGERIKVARIAAGLTQAKLGETLRVSAQFISKCERGVNNPKYSTLLKLSAPLNVSALYLLLGEEAPHAD